jgi:hypothetical protein
MGLPKAPALSSPKNKDSEADKVLMGEIKPSLPLLTQPNAKLEAALERWKRAAEGQGLLWSGQ